MDFEANNDEEPGEFGAGRDLPSQPVGDETGEGSAEPRLDDVLSSLERGGRHDLAVLAREALETPYREWIRGREGRPGEVLGPALVNLGLMEAGTGRMELSHHTVDQGKELQTMLRRRQTDIVYLIKQAVLSVTARQDEMQEDDRDEDQRQLEKQAVLQLMSLSHRLVRVLDQACILYQSATLLLEHTSSKWYTLENKYYRDVLEAHPITAQEDLSKDQRAKLVLFLLRTFQTQGFRKKPNSDVLYERVFCVGPDNRSVFTYAYGPVTSRLEDLVYETIDKELRAHLWPLLLHGGIVRDVVNYFRKSRDIELPEVKECPTLWSFNDGVYCAERDLFAYYHEVPDTFPMLGSGEYSTYKYMPGHTMAEHYFRRPFHVSTPARGIRSPHHMASPGARLTGISPRSLFSPVVSPRGGGDDDNDDVVVTHQSSPVVPPEGEDDEDNEDELRQMDVDVVPEKARLEDIEIPNILKIFRDQDWSDRTIYLALATIGRTLFPVGYLDSCQYWPCYLGVGGSGKSTILDVVKQFFHFLDIAIISADQENVFSRDKLPDKRIVLAPEVRGENFGCSLPFFLAIVGGDAVSIPVKYGEPRVVDTFPVQGIMASNELPKSYLKDPKGSLCRRLLVFPWPRAITPRDPTLKSKILKYELPAFLRACAVAYLTLPKDIDIMSNYPISDEMKKARLDLQRASNSLIDFLMSERYVLLGADHSVSMDHLSSAYREFARDEHGEKNLPAWGEDTYGNIFRMFRLEVMDEGASVRGCKLRNDRYES